MRKRIVCIGGGGGAAQILLGLKNYPVDLTGIIAVTDSGRSTGRVRVAVSIPAPGDIRSSLVNLSEGDPFLQDLFQFRFKSPKITDFDGMAFGNLFIAALSQMLGSFEKAVQKTGEFLKIRGRVIPIMLANTHIACERVDGSYDFEEVEIRAVGKSPIKRLFLKDKRVSGNPSAIKAISQAEIITLGPGSLFTTIIACLLTPGVPEALHKTKAKVVFVANTTSQPGQTDNFSIADHVTCLQEYLPKNTIDICLVNKKKPDARQIRSLKKDGIRYLSLKTQDRYIFKKLGVKIIEADLIENYHPERTLWNKQDTIRHDPKKIAKALLRLL
jgi:uncharacterized cofD-like protein